MNEVNILLFCKLFDGDAYYFSKPISNIDDIKKIYVLRDNNGENDEKITYVTTSKFRIKNFRIVKRFFQALKFRNKNIKLVIGIYELPHGLLAMLIGKILNKKTVVCIIGNPAFKELRKGFRKKLSYFIYRNVNFITTTGSKSRQFMINEGFNPNKVFILPNSIDTTYFTPTNDEKKYDIITIGRISEEKQPFILVDVINEIKKVIPNIKVGIAGKGPELENLKKYILNLNLNENIDVLGYIPSENLVNFFNIGKIFINCSKTEGLPRTVIQSYSCGTPCISSDVGDLSDLIKNDINGYLITKSDDVNSYALKAIKLLNDPNILNNFRQNGIDFVNKEYSHEASTRLWELLLNKKI